MSDYKVLNAVDETLRALLWSAVQFDSELSSILATEQDISLEPPYTLIEQDKPKTSGLSVFLYRVAENGELKNRPPEQVSPSRLRFPPLPLNLSYLITPLTASAENDHRLLSRVMQVLHANSIVKGPLLQGALAGSDEELRVTLNPLSLEDANKLWTSFMRPMRLSASYEVKVVYIDSEREISGEQVRRKSLAFTQRDAPTQT
jgi:Pvc16 N-terminal domain